MITPTARRCACGNHFRVRCEWQREDKCPGCCVREEEVAAACAKRRDIDDIEAIQQKVRNISG